MISFLSVDPLELDFGCPDPKLYRSMDSLDGSSESVESFEKRAPKLRRSCELCRASKGRCIPSKEDSNKCQKCAPSISSPVRFDAC